MGDFMGEALRLAARGRGTTAPNPMVGCVLVRDGEVVGRGWHERTGEPHAEVFALREAGTRAEGATAYVTLEPCSHFGRTPPCADALIAAGVREVHVAILDPNPLVAGRGIERLRAAGLAVHLGELEADARRLNEVFIHFITTRRPFVIAKWAMTLDGRIATRTSHARWISGPAARAHVHETRQEVGAILIGRGTALADNPALTTRLPHESDAVPRHPLRVVLDSRGTLPLTLRLFDSALPGQTLAATTAQAPLPWLDALRHQGVEVLVLPADATGRVALVPLLAAIGRREISSLLVEGGAAVHASFFAQGLVNKVHAYIAPKLVGGRDAPGPLGGAGVATMDEAVRLSWRAIERVGDDLFATADVLGGGSAERPNPG
ncbi:MAG: bifunctional diaminohydroxyphosphoribosylaminopyrimidine deaminase/5-amino-6-(5-phosphoribosylamino)uracil reductase RibD [Ardenticatenaceae bacterium]|nr:bifunctional diaminohydroxyphosphoribosylaminopyrimidine deaminase/5-amino-6-(5-phosphoribosylamino)uracil reductase RibD [Ardenticatenaceae bacterium]